MLEAEQHSSQFSVNLVQSGATRGQASERQSCQRADLQAEIFFCFAVAEEETRRDVRQVLTAC